MTVPFEKKQFKRSMYNWILDVLKGIEMLPEGYISRRIEDQLLRSSTSVMANYIEAQSALSKKEFVSYMNIARRSGNESKFWIALLKDSDRLPTTTATSLLNEWDEFTKIIASSIITSRKSLKKQSA